MRKQGIDVFRTLAPAAAAAFLALAAQPPALAAGAASTATDAKHGAATTGTTDRSGQYRAMRASHLIGMDVVNGQGRGIGEIEDVVVDLNSGEVRYAVMSFDPGILSAEKLFAVPMRQLQLPADRTQAVYDVERERLERAAIDRADWTSRFFTDEDKVARLDRAWGITQPSADARAYRVSDLMGKDVHDRRGEEIGEVDDVIIDTGRGKIHYALLEIDAGWAARDRHYAVALDSLRLADDRDELVLAVDESRLKEMGIDAARQSNLDDPRWVGDLDRRLADQTRASVGAAGTGRAATAVQFGRLDMNGDGWLTRAEARRDGEIDGDWSRLDRDGDGRVSRQEFAAVHARGVAAAPAALYAQTTQPVVPAVDRGFVDEAARGGHAEIEAARLALNRPVRAEVKDFAQRLVDDHTAANARLKAIAERKRMPVPDEPSLAQQGQLRMLRAEAGDGFESRFIREFGVDAHRNTIAKFRHQILNGRDVELVQFAQRTLPTLQEHLRQAEQLQSSLSAGAGTATRDSAAMAGAAATGSRMADVDDDTLRDARQQIDDAVQVVQRMKGDPRVTAELERARGVFILPDYGRGALGVGVQGGEGVLVTRRGDEFSDPVFYNLAGVSLGVQAGGAGGPLAMLLMTDRAVREFRSGKNFSLNADAGLTIVDFSRRAQVSQGKVEDIIVWSGTKGAYAGASVGLTGVTFDEEENQAYYGREDLSAGDILDGSAGTGRPNVLGMVLGV